MLSVLSCAGSSGYGEGAVLSSCKSLLVITEGINDAALLCALLGVEDHYFNDRKI